MITVTTVSSSIGHRTQVEEKTYKIFGLTFLKTFHNIVSDDGLYTIQGIIEGIKENAKEKLVTIKTTLDFSELQNILSSD